MESTAIIRTIEWTWTPQENGQWTLLYEDTRDFAWIASSRHLKLRYLHNSLLGLNRLFVFSGLLDIGPHVVVIAKPQSVRSYLAFQRILSSLESEGLVHKLQYHSFTDPRMELSRNVCPLDALSNNCVMEWHSSETSVFQVLTELLNQRKCA